MDYAFSKCSAKVFDFVGKGRKVRLQRLQGRRGEYVKYLIDRKRWSSSMRGGPAEDGFGNGKEAVEGVGSKSL